jgi:hypothetical protein
MNLPQHFLGAVAGAALFAVGSTALASETAALYRAYWAGLPAGDIKLVLQDDPGGYRDEITIRSEGLAWLFTKFRGTAVAEGRFADGLPAPEHYAAHYDLRKARGKRQTMRFISRAGAVFADRGPDDTSQKPPLADQFRKNVFDPLSALTAIRHELRRGNRGSFTVPVYDGARRFDVIVQVLLKKEALVGFRGVGFGSCDQSGDEGSEQGFAASARVVHELEEAEVERQLVLRDAAVRAQPGAQQRPEALDGVDVHFAEAVAVLVARILAAPVADRLVPVAPGG